MTQKQVLEGFLNSSGLCHGFGGASLGPLWIYGITPLPHAVSLLSKSSWDRCKSGDREKSTSRPNYTTRHDAFIGHARRRSDSIGCNESRTVSAQPALNTCIPHFLLPRFAPVQCMCCERTLTNLLSVVGVHQTSVSVTPPSRNAPVMPAIVSFRYQLRRPAYRRRHIG